MKTLLIAILLSLCFSIPILGNNDVFEKVDHHYADNEGVKIHYVTMGEGPVLIMLHGFPDFWYTWRYQMADLSKDYKVVAVDLRGYNKSDKPKGANNYSMLLLMQDVMAVMSDLKEEKATIIANDWGGAIAWQLAAYFPDKVERLIACNIPHPAAMRNYLVDHPSTGQYAQDFMKEGAEKNLSAKGLTSLHSGLSDTDRKRYEAAFEASSFESMLNYYRANYPRTSNLKSSQQSTSRPAPSNIKSPVLMIYGLKDKALPPGMLNDTWDYVDNEVTIRTIPEAGHFVQQEAADKVNKMIRSWLAE